MPLPLGTSHQARPIISWVYTPSCPLNGDLHDILAFNRLDSFCWKLHESFRVAYSWCILACDWSALRVLPLFPEAASRRRNPWGTSAASLRSRQVPEALSGECCHLSRVYFLCLTRILTYEYSYQPLQCLPNTWLYSERLIRAKHAQGDRWDVIRNR